MSAQLPRMISADEFAGTFLTVGNQLQSFNISGSFSATASGSMAPYRNPAGLVQDIGRGFHAITNSASLDRSSHNLSAFLNPRGDVGFGFSWLHAQVNDIKGRSSSGQVTGKIEDRANALAVSFAFKIGNRLKAGLSMKSINHHIFGPYNSNAEATGHGFDLGLQYSINKKGSLGMTVQNINSGINWKVRRGDKTRNTRDPIKAAFSLGAGYLLSEEVNFGCDLVIEYDPVANVGVAWRINELLNIAIGLYDVGATKKFGTLSNSLSLKPMRNENIVLHYAYVTDSVGAGEQIIIGLESNF